jgi:hypothetical protein
VAIRAASGSVTPNLNMAEKKPQVAGSATPASSALAVSNPLRLFAAEAKP